MRGKPPGFLLRTSEAWQVIGPEKRKPWKIKRKGEQTKLLYSVLRITDRPRFLSM
ncbi:hypothetical protein PHLCEN_2v2829 [Hermanssonia centrifuga]|uniref:Uncharacterized protein n=1 Tax=Hermanssonia centrifuga TaxID=98765 RepID=A0A2R6RI44_9APHY|nr:hypothetical protein PHLCEN_2v2829 [Hermanssonia centrifuga]